MMTLSNICELASTEEVFKNIILDSRINKELLIDRICEECGNMVSIWRDNVGAFIHYTESFFKRNAGEYKRIMDAYTSEYNPIENYDKTIESFEINTGSGTLDGTNSVSDKRSSFDSNDMQPTTSETTTKKDGTTSTNTRVYDERIHGNVGVTTNQQMIKSEMSLRKFNIYDYITNMYANNMFMRVM